MAPPFSIFYSELPEMNPLLFCDAVFVYAVLFFTSLYYMPFLYAILLLLSSILFLPHRECRKDVIASFLSLGNAIITVVCMISKGMFTSETALNLREKVMDEVRERGLDIKVTLVVYFSDDDDEASTSDSDDADDESEKSQMSNDNDQQDDNDDFLDNGVRDESSEDGAQSGNNGDDGSVADESELSDNPVESEEDSQQIKDDTGGPVCNSVRNGGDKNYRDCDDGVTDGKVKDIQDDSGCMSHKASTSSDSEGDSSVSDDDASSTRKNGVQCKNMKESSRHIEDGNGSENSSGPIYDRYNNSDCEDDGNGGNHKSFNEMLEDRVCFEHYEEGNQQQNEDCNIIRKYTDKVSLKNDNEYLRSGQIDGTQEDVGEDNISNKETAVHVLTLTDKEGNASSPIHSTGLVPLQKSNSEIEISLALVKEASSTETEWVFLETDNSPRVNASPESPTVSLFNRLGGMVKKRTSKENIKNE